MVNNLIAKGWRNRCMLLSMGCLWVSPVCHASDINDIHASSVAQLFELPLEELLQVPVVSASRISHSQSESPAAVTVFSREDLQRLGIRQVYELINYVPGFQSLRDVSQIPRHIISARGSTNQPMTGILLLVDGVPTNDTFTGGSFALGAGAFPMTLIERVEVTRGTGSSLYGNNAEYGVINIISRQAPRYARATVGSHDTFAAEVGEHLDSGKVHAWAQGSLYDDNGENYTDVFDIGERTTKTSDPRENKALNLGAKVDGLTLSGWSLRWRRHGYYGARGLLNDEEQLTYGDNQLLNLDYRTSLSDPLEWHILLSHQQFSGFLRGPRAYQSARFPQEDLLVQIDVDNRITQLASDLTWRGSDAHSFNVGINVNEGRLREYLVSQNYLLTTPPLWLGSVTPVSDLVGDDPVIRFYAFHLEDLWHVTDTLALNLGGRIDHYESLAQETSPRTTLIWQPSNAHQFRFSYSEAFRAPATGESTVLASAASIGNPDLQPERLKTLEAGYEFQSTDWNSEWVIFRSRLRDGIFTAVVPGPTPGVTVSQKQNIGEQITEGLEAALGITPTPSTRLRLTWTELFKNDTSVTTQPAPEDFISNRHASLIGEWHPDRWTFVATGRWGKQVDALPNEGDYVQLNLNTIWHYQPDLDISLMVSNLFDRTNTTAETGTGLGVNAAGEVERAIPARGRWIELSADYRW